MLKNFFATIFAVIEIGIFLGTFVVVSMMGYLLYDAYKLNKPVTCLTLYNYNGQPLRQWAGEFVLHQEHYETYFDYEGKRVVIRGGIIVAE